jgi:TetR/AcrR family transcriptional repressor of nem operon
MESIIDTRERILNVAQQFVQTRGYGAFSYRDISGTVGISTASIHYHFPSKDDLGAALIDRYRTAVKGAIAAIDSNTSDPTLRLKKYAGLFQATLRDKSCLCMCGMLAAEVATLPEGVRSGVRAFVGENEQWLSGVLAQGRKSGALEFEGPVKDQASLVFSTLEGAMLMARALGDESRLDKSVSRLFASLLPA